MKATNHWLDEELHQWGLEVSQVQGPLSPRRWSASSPGVSIWLSIRKLPNPKARSSYQCVWAVKTTVFPVVIYGCESWTIKKAEQQRIDAFKLWGWKRCLRVLWTAKEIKPDNPKGNQPWIFIGRADAETEVLILCPCDVEIRIIGKDPDAGKD